MMGIVWAILAATLILAQLFSGVFDLLFPAIAALVTALATTLIPGFGELIGLQIVLWVFTSFAALVGFRRRFRRLFRGEELANQASLHAGKQARVVEAISPEQPGRIAFQGTTWTAKSLDESLAVGSTVYILEQDGIGFLVASRLLDEDPGRRFLPK